MKKPLLLLLFLMVSMAIIAQKSTIEKPKFKKVSKEEVLKEKSDIDPTADAEYLYKGCELTYTYNSSKERFELIYDYHMRIKVYTDEGKAYADHAFAFYTGGQSSSVEKIKNIEAYTFNLKGGDVEKTKLSKKSIFEEERNKFYTIKKIAMPEVQAGSVMDIKYRLVSPYYFRIDEFYFQMDIPVEHAEFRVGTPDYFNYNYNPKGLVPVKIFTEKHQDKITLTSTIDASNDKLRVDKRRVTNDINFTREDRHYYATDIPPVSDEPFVYSMDNYRSSIKMELLYTNFPSSAPKYYTSTWDEIATTLTGQSSFGGQLKKSYGAMDELIASVADMPEDQKIATIYSDVQNRFSWDGYSNEACGDGIKKMIKSGAGNSAEINLLLVNVLKEAGVNAYPLVSRRSTSGFLNLTNPSIADLDYVVAGVMSDGGVVTYLDATDKFLTPGMLPFRALNLKTILIAGETAKEVPTINPNKGSTSKVFDLSIDGTKLIGSIKQSIKGYDAYRLRSGYATTDDLAESLQSDDVSMTDLAVEQFQEKYQSIKINSDISLKGYVQEVDGKLFVDLNIGDEEFTNPFKSETREFAMFFPSKNSSTEIIKIAIPEGYVVESVPETMNIATPEMIIKYLIKTDINGNQIVLTRRSSLNQPIVNPAYYEPIKDLYDQVEARMKEKIVLAKG